MASDIRNFLSQAFFHHDKQQQGYLQGTEIEKVLITFYKMTNQDHDPIRAKQEADQVLQMIGKDKTRLVELEELIRMYEKYVN